MTNEDILQEIHEEFIQSEYFFQYIHELNNTYYEQENLQAPE